MKETDAQPIPSFAKAAAVLAFTSGVEGYEQALGIYEELTATGEPAWSVLDKYGASRWSPVDSLDPADWLEEIEMLAKSIAASQAHFQTTAATRATVGYALYDIEHGGSRQLIWADQHEPSGDPAKTLVVPLVAEVGT